MALTSPLVILPFTSPQKTPCRPGLAGVAADAQPICTGADRFVFMSWGSDCMPGLRALGSALLPCHCLWIWHRPGLFAEACALSGPAECGCGVKQGCCVLCRPAPLTPLCGVPVRDCNSIWGSSGLWECCCPGRSSDPLGGPDLGMFSESWPGPQQLGSMCPVGLQWE